MSELSLCFLEIGRLEESARDDGLAAIIIMLLSRSRGIGEKKNSSATGLKARSRTLTASRDPPTLGAPAADWQRRRRVARRSRPDW